MLHQFDLADAQMIVNIIEGMPLQNMKAARDAQALLQRFKVFVEAAFDPPSLGEENP